MVVILGLERPRESYNYSLTLNLHISLKVLVANKKAVGVEYIRNGKKRMVGATKEVVLTAGAIGTPHLLMLSGIGPKEHLGKLKVSLINCFVIYEMSQHMRIRCFSHYRATKAPVSLRKCAGSPEPLVLVNIK